MDTTSHADILLGSLSQNWLDVLRDTSGCCGYCGVDLLMNRILYSTMQIDHIFPISEYPKYKNDPRNFVVCCWYCNNKKGKYVAGIKESPEIILADPHRRRMYIQKVARERALSIETTLTRLSEQERQYVKVLESRTFFDKPTLMDIIIPGIPYPQIKTKGNILAAKHWTKTIIEKTKSFKPLSDSPLRAEIVFSLLFDKYPPDFPYGPDLDNLLKRLLDALGQTVLKELPGKDSAIIEIHCSKQRTEDDAFCGVCIGLYRV